MVRNFIITNLDKRTDSFAISDGKYNYNVRKADLNGPVLSIGDEVTVIDHPNFPRVVAGFDLNGERIFHKSREEVIDEYLQNEEKRLYLHLPKIAKERVKMFVMFVEGFAQCDRLYEIMALNLGYRLYTEFEKEFEVFANLSYNDQKMLLPDFAHPLLPQIPAEVIVEYAQAYQKDEKAKLFGVDKKKLLNSEVMMLPNATADKRGKLCEPRSQYIRKYIFATTH